MQLKLKFTRPKLKHTEGSDERSLDFESHNRNSPTGFENRSCKSIKTGSYLCIYEEAHIVKTLSLV